MSFRKILCAIDFTESSTEALRTAVRLAIEQGSELLIVHAWFLTPTAFAGEYVYPPDMIRSLSADAEKALADTVEQAKALGAPKVTSLLADGPPWQEIVKIAERTPEVDLIVAGTRSRTGLSRMFLGSVCEMVIRHAPCSVLAIPIGASAQAFTRVLCPIDFSDSARLALELGVELSRGPDASVTLLHVVEPPRVYGQEPIVIDATTEQATAAQQHLERWASDLVAKHPIATTSLVRVGRSTLEIHKMLEDVGTFDLLAMGSHGRTGMGRMLLGSVAEKTVRHAHRAVLVARARKAAS
ncbi:MAG TPA: universal stress protein [Kofleriaceae bacterium]|nr:universal stress protein [Kofleriaceae bacterium]